MKTLYAYIRVSTVKQGEKGCSLQEQRASIEAYAQRFEFAIADWFEEKETAAKRGRPVFNRMLKLLDSGKAAGVIIHKIDRSARNLSDWAGLGELLDRGVEVYFAHESLDLSSRGGRLSADIQAVVAADFIRNLRDEVRKGFRGRLKQGLYPLPAPIGYRNQGRGLPKTPDPQTAPLVRRAFELYAAGNHNFFTLEDELHRLGLRNRRGGRVTRNGLSTLLNNEFYVGIIHIRTTDERHQGKHEPIVSKSLFDRVQLLLSGKVRNAGPKHDFLYRRALRCAHCGYSLIAERQKSWTYYRCHSKTCPTTCVREDAIELQAQENLSRLRLTPDEYGDLVDEFRLLERSAGQTNKEILQALQLSLEQLENRIARLTDALIDQLIDRATFEERKAKLLHERAALREKIDQTAAAIDSPTVRTKNFLELVEVLSDKGNYANSFERRDLLKSVTSNLYVDREKLVAAWQEPFRVLANRDEIHCGEPYRDRPRTDRAMKSLAQGLLRELAKNHLPEGVPPVGQQL